MDYRKTVHVPQLSNEMQRNVMNWVKSGKMSIDEALIRANNGMLHKQRNFEPEEKQSQYNFSVRKFNRYIWQKRVLQIDFSTSFLCSIEKGIVKRQLCFSEVKNCHDAPGTRFSISFRDRSDYELEAASLEDKQQIMQLVNQIIYSNIYSPLVNGSVEMESSPLPPPPDNLKEGHIFLQRGGLASFKWKKYEAHLQTDQLTLFPVAQQSAGGDAGSSVSSYESVWSHSDIYTSVDDVRCAGGDGTALVIHLSDGNVRVDIPCNTDTFTLHNDKNDFVFRIPKSDHMTPEAITNERDAWMNAIKQLCVDWKQKSQLEHFYEAPEKDLTDVTESESKTQKSHVPLTPPPVPPSLRPRLPRTSPNVHAAFPAAPEPETASLEASEAEPKPTVTAQSRAVHKPDRTPSPAATCSSPAPFVLPPPLPVPSAVRGPVPAAPLPPPLPMKSKQLSERTKAFHWDLLAQDKMEKSMWSRSNPRKIEIDTMRLYELFGVRETGRVGTSESISTMEIMLNSKIAHNFNIFLKSFPVQPKELKDKLLIINEEEGGLSDEHIASLRRYVPTPDDIEMYKSHKGDPSELHVVDQYMMEMCNISNLSARLDLLLTMRELPICMEDLTPLITQKIRMCLQLWTCDSFVSVLEYLLVLGNYLNQNTGKDRAKGFRLSSLTKLSQLRGNNQNFTLLHALVEQIMLREPRLATFFLELAEFETVPGASVKGLTAEVDVVKNEFQKIVQYRKTYSKSKNEVNHQTKFFKDLKAAIEKHEADLRQLMKRSEEMRKLYTDILIKFGEPLDQDSQKIFGWIFQFVNDFKKVYSEYAQ
ncbi:formin-like protein 3 [Sinocyclocheilus grahami]|uniref:formin-like protein 3 n=1 Tax=Sinocyclocheilus grahami TaxID=75366 RepID=UPI0007AD2C90|nr:PREDICTED: formin-like protein 3 [Sinocyclocheilus grahami]